MRALRDSISTKFLLFMLLFVLIEPVVANTIGTVRYVEVIAAHPRMLKFDFSTHRFNDGQSAQISLEKLQKRGRELEARLQEVNSRSGAALTSLEKSLTSSSKKKGVAESDFWAEKEKLDNEIESVRVEIAANIAAMEFGGQTIETTILPEITQIITDVNAAIANAAKTRKCTMVFNETLPIALVKEADPWIEEAYSAHVRSGNNSDAQSLRRWVASADRIAPRLGAQVNLLKPVITASVDLTSDAVKLLSQPVRKGGVLRK